MPNTEAFFTSIFSIPGSVFDIPILKFPSLEGAQEDSVMAGVGLSI
jgi:hypothetical protein